MQTQMDLFELLQMMTGALQISDLPHAPYQRRAAAIIEIYPIGRIFSAGDLRYTPVPVW